VDISGFTALAADAEESGGKRGVEDTAAVVSAYFSVMMTAIADGHDDDDAETDAEVHAAVEGTGEIDPDSSMWHAHRLGTGGPQVCAFLGDALLVWVPTVTDGLKAALRVAAAAGEYRADTGALLTCRLTLVAGDCVSTIMGNQSRLSHVLLSRAFSQIGELDNAVKAQNLASPGSIVLSVAALERFLGLESGDRINPSQYGLAAVSVGGRPVGYRIEQEHVLQSMEHELAAAEQVPAPAAPVRSSSADAVVPHPRRAWSRRQWVTAAERSPELARWMGAFVPTRVQTSLDGAGGRQELRNMSIVFFSVNTDLDFDAASVERLNACVRIVLADIEPQGGVLRQVVQDDKGFVIIVVYGQPRHSDDPLRAAVTAVRCHAAMGAQLSVGSSVGVTTGGAFTGLVGSERRREFVVFGTVVNMAARLMGKAEGSILCDEATAMAVQSATGVRVKLGAPRRVQVKGRTEDIDAYPLMPRSASAGGSRSNTANSSPRNSWHGARGALGSSLLTSSAAALTEAEDETESVGSASSRPSSVASSFRHETPGSDVRGNRSHSVTISGHSSPTNPSSLMGSTRREDSTGSGRAGISSTVSKEHAVFVGRADEMAVLHESMQRTRSAPDAPSEITVVQGSAGSGKSSLLRRFRREVMHAEGSDSLTVVTSGALEMDTGTLWSGTRGLLESLNEVSFAVRPFFTYLYACADSDDSERIAALRLRVKETMPKMDDHCLQLAPLLRFVLGIPVPDTAESSAVREAARSAALITLLVQLFDCVPRPLLLLVEDGHWIDSLTWELLQQLLNRTSGMCLVVSTRPLDENRSEDSIPVLLRPDDDVNEVSAVARRTFMDLESLTVENIAEMMTKVLPGKPKVAHDTAAFVHERSRGNALLALTWINHYRNLSVFEENSRAELQLSVSVRRHEDDALLSTGTSGHQDSTRSAVEHLIQAQFDGLAPSQQAIVKVAAVYGDEFTRGDIDATLKNLSIDAGSDADWKSIGSSSFLHSPSKWTGSKVPPSARFLFRHALVRVAVYELMPAALRVSYHGAVAKVIRERHPFVKARRGSRGFSDNLEALRISYNAVVARHAERAEDWPLAVTCLDTIARAYFRSYQTSETLDVINRTIAANEKCAPDVQRPSEEVAEWYSFAAYVMYGTDASMYTLELCTRSLELVGWQVPTESSTKRAFRCAKLVKQLRYHANHFDEVFGSLRGVEARNAETAARNYYTWFSAVSSLTLYDPSEVALLMLKAVELVGNSSEYLVTAIGQALFVSELLSAKAGVFGRIRDHYRERMSAVEQASRLRPRDRAMKAQTEAFLSAAQGWTDRENAYRAMEESGEAALQSGDAVKRCEYHVFKTVYACVHTFDLEEVLEQAEFGVETAYPDRKALVLYSVTFIMYADLCRTLPGTELSSEAITTGLRRTRAWQRKVGQGPVHTMYAQLIVVWALVRTGAPHDTCAGLLEAVVTEYLGQVMSLFYHILPVEVGLDTCLLLMASSSNVAVRRASNLWPKLLSAVQAAVPFFPFAKTRVAFYKGRLAEVKGKRSTAADQYKRVLRKSALQLSNPMFDGRAASGLLRLKEKGSEKDVATWKELAGNLPKISPYFAAIEKAEPMAGR
jgi:class 3 adenylate cyclase